MSRFTTLRHGRIELALHALRGDGPPHLLLLHELGGRAPERPPAALEAWPGSLWALDFTGHGDSSLPAGGGYSAEILMADADAALAHLGEATLVGFGLGAYVALLLAGSRPLSARGAVLGDGRGLAGGGPRGAPLDLRPALAGAAPPDPFALHELSRDARPPGYARLFARQAHHLSPLADPVSVAASERPPWLEAVADHAGVVTRSLEQALRSYG